MNRIQTAPLLPTLRKRAQFLAHRRSARQVLPAFTLQGHLRPCAENGGLAAGYTVSKKTGNSVERNRIKRRLRHALAIAVKKASLQGSTSANGDASTICGELVVIARRQVLAQTHDRLVADFTKGIDRLLAKGKKAPT